MSRASAPSHSRAASTPSVSLFPFLAVLVCTMGVLILLLVVMVRSARLQAAEAMRAKAATQWPSMSQIAAALEELQWQEAELRDSRQATEGQLAEARLKLGHVEDHSRRLRQQIAQLESVWAGLEAAEPSTPEAGEATDAELQRLRHQIAQVQAELDQARQRRSKPRSYAVVPYLGPHGTRRRPIYLECRADAVVLQPEGVELQAGDFLGPLGPGNPLDVALRAVREHLLAHGGMDLEPSGEPYPLLLVRPSGIEAYYAARAAMTSWGTEFGYELIGEDWRLAFPTPDGALAEVLHRAVGAARARQQLLARAAPRHFSSEAPSRYRPAPYRGGVIRDDGGPVEPSAYQAPAVLGRPVRRGPQSAHAPDAQPDEARLPGPAPGEGPVAHEGQDPGYPPVSARRPGEWMEPPERTQPAQGEAQATDQARCLADTRGPNWGLPDAAAGSVPLTRPIRVDCYPDRLVLVPESGLASATTVALPARTEEAIDQFVSAVWEYMETWGIAGKGMYWKPVLLVHVAPGAEARLRDLEVLLGHSGLEVTRKP